jgi:hypothetical protein
LALPFLKKKIEALTKSLGHCREAVAEQKEKQYCNIIMDNTMFSDHKALKES